jgi:Holliday junction resolvase-like predicted endonuclease
MVLRQSIEKLLVASENSFVSSNDPQISAHSRGEALELAVCHWLERSGYLVALRRFKTPFAEIDILAMGPKRDFSLPEILLIEVKSSLWPDDCALNLSRTQRLRLQRACQWVREELADISGLSDLAVDIRLVVPEAMRRNSFRMFAIF